MVIVGERLATQEARSAAASLQFWANATKDDVFAGKSFSTAWDLALAAHFLDVLRERLGVTEEELAAAVADVRKAAGHAGMPATGESGQVV